MERPLDVGSADLVIGPFGLMNVGRTGAVFFFIHCLCRRKPGLMGQCEAHVKKEGLDVV